MIITTETQPVNSGIPHTYRTEVLISRNPEDRVELINTIKPMYKEGDLIFSVKWSPEASAIENLYTYSSCRHKFEETVDHFIGMLCHEIGERNNGIEPDNVVIFEQNGQLFTQANLIIEMPVVFKLHHINADYMVELWGQACTNSDIQGDLFIQANGKVIDVGGWVSNMIKPYRSNTDIFISLLHHRN